MKGNFCPHCGASLSVTRISFREVCEKCGNDLHTCVCCVHYAPGKPNDCNEPNAEPVRDKERNNRCEWFSLTDKKKEKGLSKEEANRLLRDLFRKKES
jgi:hypothetical protein